MPFGSGPLTICTTGFLVGPPFLQYAIHLEADVVQDSWLVGFKADLAWMHEVNPGVLPEGWQDDLTQLVGSWQANGTRWKSQVRAMARKHQFQESMMAEVISMHKNIFGSLRQNGASFSPDPFHQS